jgi:hypothetical protein
MIVALYLAIDRYPCLRLSRFHISAPSRRKFSTNIPKSSCQQAASLSRILSSRHSAATSGASANVVSGLQTVPPTPEAAAASICAETSRQKDATLSSPHARCAPSTTPHRSAASPHEPASAISTPPTPEHPANRCAPRAASQTCRSLPRAARSPMMFRICRLPDQGALSAAQRA